MFGVSRDNRADLSIDPIPVLICLRVERAGRPRNLARTSINPLAWLNRLPITANLPARDKDSIASTPGQIWSNSFVNLTRKVYEKLQCIRHNIYAHVCIMLCTRVFTRRPLLKKSTTGGQAKSAFDHQRIEIFLSSTHIRHRPDKGNFSSLY